MKHFFCHKCNEVLPKWNTVCDKCGYFNEELYPNVERTRIRRRVIIVLSLLLSLVVLLIICNVLMLFPWQYQARHNRKVILTYAQEKYPGAKIIEEYYPTMKFNPTGDPYDVIWFELDGMEFYIEARDGKVDYDDGYGVALLEKELHENYLNTFFP